MITAAGWAERAATGGLIVILRDPTTGRHGVARWYALGVQSRLEGGADVICAWGRLGHHCGSPHQRAHLYASWPEARVALKEQLERAQRELAAQRQLVVTVERDASVEREVRERMEAGIHEERAQRTAAEPQRDELTATLEEITSAGPIRALRLRRALRTARAAQ